MCLLKRSKDLQIRFTAVLHLDEALNSGDITDIIIIIIALQPFVGSWPLFQVLDLIQSR
jgi:hypothetical protein